MFGNTASENTLYSFDDKKVLINTFDIPITDVTGKLQ